MKKLHPLDRLLRANKITYEEYIKGRENQRDSDKYVHIYDLEEMKKVILK